MDLFQLNILKLVGKVNVLYKRELKLESDRMRENNILNDLNDEETDLMQEIGDLEDKEQVLKQLQEHVFLKKFLKALVLSTGVISITIAILSPIITSKIILFISWLSSFITMGIMSLWGAYAPYLERRKDLAGQSLEDITREIEEKDEKLLEVGERKEKIENEVMNLDIKLSEVNSLIKKLEDTLTLLRDARGKAIDEMIERSPLVEDGLNKTFQSEENVLKLIRELDEGGR